MLRSCMGFFEFTEFAAAVFKFAFVRDAALMTSASDPYFAIMLLTE